MTKNATTSPDQKFKFEQLLNNLKHSPTLRDAIK